MTHAINMSQRFIPLSFTHGERVADRAGAGEPATSRRPATTCSGSSTRTASPRSALLYTSGATVADTQPPTAPTGLASTGGAGFANLTWAASSDNVAVVKYNVHRSTTRGFTPSAANRIAQPVGTSYTDSGLPAGTYYYKVTAQDAAGNVGPRPNAASAIVTRTRRRRPSR